MKLFDSNYSAGIDLRQLSGQPEGFVFGGGR